jgi:hypothetical protein
VVTFFDFDSVSQPSLQARIRTDRGKSFGGFRGAYEQSFRVRKGLDRQVHHQRMGDYKKFDIIVTGQ